MSILVKFVHVLDHKRTHDCAMVAVPGRWEDVLLPWTELPYQVIAVQWDVTTQLPRVVVTVRDCPSHEPVEVNEAPWEAAAASTECEIPQDQDPGESDGE